MTRRLLLSSGLALLLASPVAPGAQVFPRSCLGGGCTLELAPNVYLLNNHWNVRGATGSQSITAKSPMAWSTTWDWTRPEAWAVTSYAAAITGWHWGWRIPAAQTGLPVSVTGPHKLLADVAFTLTPGGAVTYNVAFDLWFHATPTPKVDGSEPRVEMMIWLAYSQETLGVGQSYLAARPAIGGHRWKVLVASTRRPSPPDTIAFLIDEPNLMELSVDLKGFLAWTVRNQPGLLPPSWYLTSIQFGPEAYRGRATLDVTRYAVAVRDPA